MHVKRNAVRAACDVAGERQHLDLFVELHAPVVALLDVEVPERRALNAPIAVNAAASKRAPMRNGGARRAPGRRSGTRPRRYAGSHCRSGAACPRQRNAARRQPNRDVRQVDDGWHAAGCWNRAKPCHRQRRTTTRLGSYPYASCRRLQSTPARQTGAAGSCRGVTAGPAPGPRADYVIVTIDGDERPAPRAETVLPVASLRAVPSSGS